MKLRNDVQSVYAIGTLTRPDLYSYVLYDKNCSDSHFLTTDQMKYFCTSKMKTKIYTPLIKPDIAGPSENFSDINFLNYTCEFQATNTLILTHSVSLMSSMII